MVSAVSPHDQPLSVGHEVAERLWVLTVAGISTGVVVAGLGSRLAMLVLRLTSPDGVRGVTSDDGFEIGRFTYGGTYNLLVIGAIVGVIGAAAYRAVAPWLLGPVWFRRFTVAAASGVVVGSMLVHADGIDFHVLEPLWLAVALFVALPAIFGAAIAVAVDRTADHPVPTGRRRFVIPALLVAAFPPVIPFVLVTAVVLMGWVPLRRAIASSEGVPTVVGLSIRAGWSAVAALGLLGLLRDLQALA